MVKFKSPKIVLMVRDPLWIFCYWNVHQDSINEGTLILKLDNITRHETIDIAIDKYADNWHIYTGYPDEEFRVRIGTTINGVFNLIACSNIVRTPRNSPSNLDEYFFDTFYFSKKIYSDLNLHINLSSKFM